MINCSYHTDERLNSVRLKQILLLSIVLLLLFTGCSKTETKEIPTPSPLQLKSEYVTLINDDIITDMVEEQYTNMVDAFNNRKKDTGEIELDKSVTQYSEFITADIEKAQNSNNNEKADLLLELEHAYLSIIESTTNGSLMLSKDSKGNYDVSPDTKISDEDIQSIKEELTNKIEQYFK